MGWSATLKQFLISEEVKGITQKMPKKVGSFGYDPWGYNKESFQMGFTFFKWLYDHYFRVQASGLENIPKSGRLLIIGNHSGQLPMDGILVGIAMASNPHAPRTVRAMIERFFPTVPFLGNWLNHIGAVVGDPSNCVKLLEREEAIIVFPEGIRGSGKPFKQRYQLQRFGTGFLRIAIQTNAPIIPVGVVGCEETMPSLGNLKPLANLLHIPYFPITLPFVLPSKVYLHFGKPIYLEGDIDSESEMEEKVELVKGNIRDLIQEGLRAREKDTHEQA